MVLHGSHLLGTISTLAGLERLQRGHRDLPRASGSGEAHLLVGEKHKATGEHLDYGLTMTIYRCFFFPWWIHPRIQVVREFGKIWTHFDRHEWGVSIAHRSPP